MVQPPLLYVSRDQDRPQVPRHPRQLLSGRQPPPQGPQPSHRAAVLQDNA